jgi:hypothetical protein
MKLKTAMTLLALLLGLTWSATQFNQAADPPQGKATIIDAGQYPDLQAAFDAVPATGGLIRLPPGRFELHEPLVLSSEDTRLEGSGAATHLVNQNQEGQPALVLRPKDRAANARQRIWRVQLADFRISGNPKSGDGLLAEGINEIYLHGLSIDHHGGHGINLVDCYEDPRVSDCILTYNGQAGLNILRGHDIVVSSNQFEENQDALRCIDSFNLCMTGNCLDDHLRHGVVIENTYGSVLSGNMIEECRGTAIILDRDCYGITLSANVIAHEQGGGIELRDAWGCAVSGNTFTIVAQRALVVGPASGRIAICGNNFANSFRGDTVKREDAATGVELENTTDITVSGNVFAGLAAGAVRVTGECPRLVIAGNTMSKLFRGAEAKGPALELGTSRDAVVTDNAIEP